MQVLSLFRRAKRYVYVYVWLLKQQLRFHPFLFVTRQALSVGARILTMAGLITCAHFLARLINGVERPAHSLSFGIEISADQYKALLIVVPVALLLIAAVSQHLATVLHGRTMRAMVGALARDYSERLSREGIPAYSGSGYLNLIHLLIRVESRFIVLIQNVLVLSGVILGSLKAVGPILTMNVLILLAVFAGIFLLFRQKHAHELHRKLRDIDRTRLAFLQGFAETSPNDKLEPSSSRMPDIAALNQLNEVAQDRYYLSWSFNELSRVPGLIVQALLVLALLLYISSMEVTEPHQFAWLVTFFVIARFAFATVQAINSTALAIVPDYRALVQIMQGRDYRDTSSNASTAINDEEDGVL